MWDGRFSVPSDRLLERFNNSLPFDQVLLDVDLDGSIAWAGALRRIGVYNEADYQAVIKGLEGIRRRYCSGELTFSAHDEDIHMAVERLLIEAVGEAGERLHTGRSRNDQVATDVRLFVLRKMKGLADLVEEFLLVLVDRAQKDAGSIMPGYTHLQQAQPVLVAHYWLSLFWALERDRVRIAHAAACADCMPLGSGALAGCGFLVDREQLARELGFSRCSENSMDGVASRDFALESLAALSQLGITLSRYAEDLIVWSSTEFGFVELDDAWSTGSSMMPQKKNPDSLELVRGKAGRFIGNYTRLAATVKGVGLTYYKDLQEDKEPLFDSIGQMELVLRVFAKVVATLTLKGEVTRARLNPLLLATDVADYLVEKGLPFRKAHKVVGALVKWCVNEGVELNSVALEKLRAFSDRFEADVEKVFDWQAAIEHRGLPGGTGSASVAAQITRARTTLKALRH